MEKKLSPITPGDVLIEEFLRPMGISQNKLAKDINVPANRISQIIHGKRDISADTALRLGKYFGIEPEFWLNLQLHCEPPKPFRLGWLTLCVLKKRRTPYEQTRPLYAQHLV